MGEYRKIDYTQVALPEELLAVRSGLVSKHRLFSEKESADHYLPILTA